ncbi:ROK family protein [Edaphobacter aggregans]|uniref:ROK family protein n=1 Tax=Edaphobacter aggregans TaxID=570835 RepID=UPI0006915F54|nr:ROK family protein [Edaphobacter aggregans]
MKPQLEPGYLVGIDIGGTNLRLALANTAGAIVSRWSTTVAGHRSSEAIVHLIRTGIENLLRQASLPWSALKAVAAGAPGITNVDSGVVIVTSYLLGWRDVPLRNLLETATGVPAAVDNDVNLAALGESRMGAAQDSPDFVFLAIGTGIGAGIITNGKLLRGSSWAAGEIGYMLVPGAPDEPVERGKPGPLEGMIGGEGIRSQWQQLWKSTATSLPHDANATQIFDAALKGDPLAQTILQQTARLLCYALLNVSLVLNCPLFVLGGGVGIHPALLDATQRNLERWSGRTPVQLRPSVLAADAQLRGAICLALETLHARDSQGRMDLPL